MGDRAGLMTPALYSGGEEPILSVVMGLALWDIVCNIVLLLLLKVIAAVLVV